MAITKLNVQGVSDAIATDLNNVDTALALAGRRNLVINGAMQVAQRGTSSTGISDSFGYTTVDRMRTQLYIGTWTSEQSTDAPDGFANSFKLTCTTGEASPGAGDVNIINYRLEAQDLQQLAYGTSGAQTMALSFWVKSNKIGTASLGLTQEDNSSKLYTSNYSISSADTWEYKTVTITGDTAGVINNDTGIGLIINWWLNSGSTYTGGSATDSWETYNGNQNSDNLSVGGATSDYFAITGVQLEVGDTATDFEHRSYGEELALCQRYYWTEDMSDTYHALAAGYFASSSVFIGFIPMPTALRSAPTLSYSGSWQAAATSSTSVSSMYLTDNSGANLNLIQFRANTSGNIANAGGMLRNANDSTAKFALDAEL